MDKATTVNIQTFLNEHPFSGFQWLIFAMCFVVEQHDDEAHREDEPLEAGEWVLVEERLDVDGRSFIHFYDPGSGSVSALWPSGGWRSPASSGGMRTRRQRARVKAMRSSPNCAVAHARASIARGTGLP